MSLKALFQPFKPDEDMRAFQAHALKSTREGFPLFMQWMELCIDEDGDALYTQEDWEVWTDAYGDEFLDWFYRPFRAHMGDIHSLGMFFRLQLVGGLATRQAGWGKLFLDASKEALTPMDNLDEIPTEEAALERLANLGTGVLEAAIKVSKEKDKKRRAT